MLLTDPNHAVDVLVQRSRVRGIMLGTGGDDLRLRSGSTIGRLEYVRGVVDVVVGDVLVTSGLDGRYPAGIPVGELTKVRRTTEGTLDYAEVVPFVDWNAIQLVSLVRVEGDL